MPLLTHIQKLYDNNHFLDAFQQSAEYWKPSTPIDGLSVDELILGGRLAARLGGVRLSHRLFRAAYARDSDKPSARYFTSHLRRRRSGLLENLREFEACPDFCAEDAEMQAAWLASHAVTYALLRDFTRAHDCLERAHGMQSKDPWVTSCESDVLGLEDRWEEALECAERAWEIKPGTPYAARSLSNSLLTLCRVPESARRLAAASENCQSCEIVHLACWHQCALSETLSGDDRRHALDVALEFAKNLPSLAPLADRDFHRIIASVRLDIATLSDDHTEMARWAGEMRIPFYRKILTNLRQNHEGRRIRLPFPRAIQKHETCLPTSLSSALSTMGEHVDPVEMASEITFGGTWDWAAADWLEARGFAIRHFALTQETASRLIDHGIGFVLTLEGDDNAHAVAVVGLDEAAGTLIIHDPMAYRTAEYLLEGFAKNHGPLGTRAMVAVPKAKAALLDQLLCKNDVVIMTAVQMQRKALILRGPMAAREIVESIAEKHPSHPGTRLLNAVQAAEEGRSGEALLAFQQLLNEFQHSPLLRSQLIWACRSRGNTTLMRETLAGVVERGVLPGVQSEQVWFYPPPRYVAEYAEILHFSAETRSEAKRLLHGLIRRQPHSADGWHILGDLLWKEQDTEGALVCFRIAACQASNHEHYARTYADALAQSHREEEGFSWLEARVRRFGRSPRAAGTWITWISALEEWGHPARALAASTDALAQYGRLPEFLGFAVPFLARMGLWQEAEEHLQELASGDNIPRYHEAALGFYRSRGDLQRAIEHGETWVREAPRSMPARYALIDLIAKRDSAPIALQLAAQWLAEHPSHDEIEELYYRQLDRAGEPKQKKYSVLLRRLKRNPQDGWAWRELTFCCIGDYERASDRRRERLEVRVQALLEHCDRTGKEDPATIRVHAQWRQARGQWTQSIAGWLDSIDREPANSHGYERVFECLSQFDLEQRLEILHRIDSFLLRCPGHLTVARTLVPLLAQRFGFAVAEDAVSRWGKLRPDDPEIAESLADLLLEHGHGRTDTERAYATLQSAVEHFPYQVGLRLSLVHACRELGRLNEAEEGLREIIRRHPDNAAARIQLAWVCDLRGQGNEARKMLEEASAKDPQNKNNLDALIQVLIRHDGIDQAKSIIHTALESVPHDVSWRNRAIQLLLDCGDENAAVEAARAGVRVYPRGAYAWFQLGMTLHQLRQFAQPGEIEGCFRRSLTFNYGFFDAADHLSMLLIEQRRFDEAEQIMHNIQPRLCDPSPPQGRLAWIHRQQGKRREALEEIVSTVRNFPWYQWGWSLLMEWLIEDQAWRLTHELLDVIPPEVLTVRTFRRQRLAVLEHAGLAVEELDAEWRKLLHDFPEDLPLHLHRYDLLRGAKRVAESRSVLSEAHPVNPDDPYYLARLVEVYSEERRPEDAIAAMQRIFFAETEGSAWPAEYAWEALKNAQYGDRAHQEACASLERKLRPTPTAFSVLCSYALEEGGTEKVIPQTYWKTWFPDRGVKEMLRLLNIADHSPWASGVYRSKALGQLNKVGHYRLVVKYWKKHRQEGESDVTSWSETGYALASLKQKQETRRLLSSWRQRRGVGMWVVANYVGSLSRRKPSDLREVVASCGDALRHLPHDQCARFLAHLRAEACVLLGDKEGLLDTWQQYRSYFDCKENNQEWFPPGRRHLLTDIPILVRYLEQNETGLYRKTVWGLRWRHLSGSFSDPRSARNSETLPWWTWWIVGWMLIQLLRLIMNNGT